MPDSQNILKIPYRELPVSGNLKRAFNFQKCENLEALLKKRGTTLRASRGFGEVTMKDLYDFLKLHKLEHLLL